MSSADPLRGNMPRVPSQRSDSGASVQDWIAPVDVTRVILALVELPWGGRSATALSRMAVVRRIVLLFLVALPLGLSGCGGGDGGDDPEANAADAATIVSDASEVAATDEEPVEDQPIRVPDGNAEELFAFMERIEIEELGAAESDDEDVAPLSAEAQARKLTRLMNARVETCDKILESDPGEDSRHRAIRIRLDALRTLAALDPVGRQSDFDDFVERLGSGSDPLLARMARATQFQSTVNRFLSTGEPDPETLLSELETLLATEDAGPEILDAARDAIGWVFQNGDVSLASRGFRMLGERYRDDADELIAGEAETLISQSINIELTSLAQAAAGGDAAAKADLLAKMKNLLAPSNVDPSVLAFAMQSAQFLEFSGFVGEARTAYRMIWERYRGHEDQSLRETVKTSVDLAVRRLDLVGTNPRLQGVLLDGRAFDWDEYRGKWTVVYFWATWYPDWSQEMANIRQAVQMHHDDVEVVLINLDDDRNQLERYLKESPSPWTVVVSADPNETGSENANAIRCGVEAIPFAFLVDPDGTVVDIHLLGDRLSVALDSNLRR